MAVKKNHLQFLALSLFSLSPLAMAADYPQIYPFVPYPTENVIEKVKQVAEDQNAIVNIFDMHRMGLVRGQTAEQPWGSTYWPLNQGLIASPYQERFNPIALARLLRWQRNYNLYQRRLRNELQNWHELDNGDLDKLAPSEKYDILMGDYSFDLTKRMWSYVKKWGEDKQNSFTDIDGDGETDIDMAFGLAHNWAAQRVLNGQASNLENALRITVPLAQEKASEYKLGDYSDRINTWSGICHGWSTAAGIVPRPKHTVEFVLPNGKGLRFFPADIKALASLYWANSLAQDSASYLQDGTIDPQGGGILSAGLRCNQGSVKRDEWGRFYDDKLDPVSLRLEDRCSGVHPAIWHLSLINILGKQKRSFIVERKVTEAVDNHPMSGYRMQFFNPYNGNYGALSEVVKPLTNRDQFFSFRNPETRSIVGVKTTMKYIDWTRPDRANTNSERDDEFSEIEMLYDLELNQDGDIIGGQWRTIETGRGGLVRGDRTQPNFLWVVTKHHQQLQYLQEPRLEPWNNLRATPPQSWKQAALDRRRGPHNFYYTNTFDSCLVEHKENGDKLNIPCTTKINRPQPLLNVLNKLIELSRR